MTPGDRANELIGAVLDGRYRIDSLLGIGGMGAVYRARHLNFEQTVAVKVLLPKLTSDETAARRFVREAKSTFRLDHPHCVRVSDFGAFEGILYLVMEYLDGRTVHRELEVDGPVSSARGAHILAQVASALDYAHGLGLVHRDLKSENIMLIQRGHDGDFAKVLDFGLAKMWDPEGGGLSTMMSISPLTQEGLSFGTPHYMSPEQARGDSLGPASDVFALGVVAYEMLTGQLPFQDPNLVQVLTSIVVDDPAPPRTLRGDLDPALDALVMQCLAKAPERRPGPCAAIADELKRIEGAARSPRTPTPAPSSTVLTSETIELSAAPAMPSPGSLDTRAAIAAGVKRPRAQLWIAAAALAVLVGGAVAIVAASSSGTGRATSASAKVADRDAGAVPATAAEFVDAGARAGSGDASPVGTARQIPAQVVKIAEPPGTAARSKRGSPGRRPAANHTEPVLTDKQRQAKTLVAEAKAAGDNLGRMSKAHAALRLDPGNLEAHYLFGSALVTSGNRTRGCKHLKRAFRLSKARTKFRSERCGEASD